MTPAEIIYQRRIAVLEHAQRTGNVAETCRVFSISRTRYYQWKNVADRYGLDALMPKARRAPQMPDATPTHVIQALLTLAVVEPTIGCRQYADRLGDRGLSIAKSTVQKHLVAHGLGRRSERLEMCIRDRGVVHRSDHDHDDGPPGEDVDGAELVHLAHTLQLPDVEAVQADQLTGASGGQAEPEELVVSGRFLSLIHI